MSAQVNVHEAKTHLSKLLERVEAGAQARLERLTLVSRDARLEAYDVDLLAA